MTPAARISAAIEILDHYLSGQPAEQVLTSWARSHRYAGSKDRAAIRDHVYDALRRLRSSQALGGGEDGRAVMIGLLRGQGIDPAPLFTGEGYAPAPLTADEHAPPRALSRAEQLDCPDWLLALFDQSLGPQADAVLMALRDRAPVFLRVNLARSTRAAAIQQLAEEGIQTRPHPLSPTALEVTANPRRITASRAYQDGAVELQDVASQAVVDALNITPGLRVLDYCAGGGGKSLALAALGADVVAHDAAPQRMKDLPERARRAGARIRLAKTGDLADLGPFDLILADAPCSGSGSWRRAPHGKWLLSDSGLNALCDTQRDILNRIADLTPVGGRLAYATCSVLAQENGAQVQRLCKERAGISLLAERQFTPLDGGDGFYISHLKRS